VVCGTHTVSVCCVSIVTDALLGYIGRALMHENPWDKNAFQMQICTIILGPTFICVSIYLTLKHVSLHLNPQLSRLPPKWYPRIFLPADLSCLIVQAIGGGIAAAAKRDNKALLDSGNRAIIAGIVLQVVVLFIFGILGTDYYLRLRKYLRSSEASPEALALWHDRKFRLFVQGVTGAFFTILLRCIYRYVVNLSFSLRPSTHSIPFLTTTSRRPRPPSIGTALSEFYYKTI
jgi:hypothetical protein